MHIMRFILAYKFYFYCFTFLFICNIFSCTAEDSPETNPIDPEPGPHGIEITEDPLIRVELSQNNANQTVHEIESTQDKDFIYATFDIDENVEEFTVSFVVHSFLLSIELVQKIFMYQGNVLEMIDVEIEKLTNNIWEIADHASSIEKRRTIDGFKRRIDHSAQYFSHAGQQDDEGVVNYKESRYIHSFATWLNPYAHYTAGRYRLKVSRSGFPEMSKDNVFFYVGQDYNVAGTSISFKPIILSNAAQDRDLIIGALNTHLPTLASDLGFTVNMLEAEVLTEESANIEGPTEKVYELPSRNTILVIIGRSLGPNGEHEPGDVGGSASSRAQLQGAVWPGISVSLAYGNFVFHEHEDIRNSTLKDFSTVLLHEMGHLAGLDHPSNPMVTYKVDPNNLHDFLDDTPEFLVQNSDGSYNGDSPDDFPDGYLGNLMLWIGGGYHLTDDQKSVFHRSFLVR